MLDFKTVYGARINKKIRVYFLADSSEHDEMMCCIFKKRMYLYYFRERRDSNQKLYEGFVESLALFNKQNKRNALKKMITNHMIKEDYSDLRDIVDNLSDEFIADVSIN
ncbi:MAG: hypothetical protein A2Y45_08240 [Tenericutes bacterium GWC2_34_14]|nr:MAG: hypothetical protein A2Z84_03235 [Tenericutes bacterium GWA2_35_7]OHE29885.1 MAG: hypothetical protein A2Y45_08240 [Tenericutes bacterium GWC2_34_14]OHE34864.1 MAG: hypothetical protein A2012_01850 [Tenericutes bacterium GWE2_34_108]OHE37275.1 MAG: hypothetical protein A2Y46_01160 [Tenericutes bacterium GWF1_35_14]OHE39592.1 MAG: hypothetical protein A2Y44_01700 [Tenericutes bacterium GWF2_35_184]OHE41294.1 MAG: hypothetical protein A3K26_06335 [Tenericutes bacterium RIFOXYA12_FULL_35_